MSFNSGVIVVVISNQPRSTRSIDLKSLARLLPELYSTQSYYHYLSLLLLSLSSAAYSYPERKINDGHTNVGTYLLYRHTHFQFQVGFNDPLSASVLQKYLSK